VERKEGVVRGKWKVARALYLAAFQSGHESAKFWCHLHERSLNLVLPSMHGLPVTTNGKLEMTAGSELRVDRTKLTNHFIVTTT